MGVEWYGFVGMVVWVQIRVQDSCKHWDGYDFKKSRPKPLDHGREELSKAQRLCNPRLGNWTLTSMSARVFSMVISRTMRAAHPATKFRRLSVFARKSENVRWKPSRLL